jgi:hypothetical protein
VNTWTGLFRLALLFPALWWAVAIAKSIVAVSWMHAAVALVGTMLNLFVAAKMLKLPLYDLGKALLPAMISGAFMAVAVLTLFVLTSDTRPWIQLLGSVFLGGVVYSTTLWFFQRSVMLDAIKIIQKVIKKG